MVDVCISRFDCCADCIDNSERPGDKSCDGKSCEKFKNGIASELLKCRKELGK